jgi:hypothetical protein
MYSLAANFCSDMALGVVSDQWEVISGWEVVDEE